MALLTSLQAVLWLSISPVKKLKWYRTCTKYVPDTYRTCTGHVPYITCRKKGLGVTVRKEGSDGGGTGNERSLKVLVANVRDLKSGTKLEEFQLLAKGFWF